MNLNKLRFKVWWTMKSKNLLS